MSVLNAFFALAVIDEKLEASSETIDELDRMVSELAQSVSNLQELQNGAATQKALAIMEKIQAARKENEELGNLARMVGVDTGNPN